MTEHPARSTRTLIGFALLYVFLSGGCLLAPEDPEPSPGDVTVLFIGSSYFGAWDMIDHFRKLCDEGGQDVFIGSFVRSGLYLDDLAREPGVAAKISERDWDYVILQGVGTTTAYPETHHLLTSYGSYHPVYPALQTFKAMVNATGDSTRIIFQMPFAFEDGMLWVGMDDDYFAMQQLCYDNTLAWAGALDLGVAPVGWAWREILLEEPGTHYLHASDWNHPSLRGAFLMAVVFHATVCNESCAGYAYRAGMPSAEAAHLRETGSVIVQGNRRLWNLRE